MKRYLSYKPSGVEWIGEIPESWRVVKLGYVSKPIQGVQLDVEKQLRQKIENSERFIRISDYTMDEEPRYIENFPFNCKVNEDDLVMVRYGSKSGKVYRGIMGVICNNVFRIELSTELTSEFGYYFLNQELFYTEIEKNRDNTTLPQVSHSLYKEMKISLPSLQEQIEIVEFLDEKTKEIDEMIQLEQKKIDLLKEYRKSLISEVVTGKIKVTSK